MFGVANHRHQSVHVALGEGVDLERSWRALVHEWLHVADHKLNMNLNHDQVRALALLISGITYDSASSRLAGQSPDLHLVR